MGMAVDGNVLIFERAKEELRHGKKLSDAIKDGFKRAWTAIWDGNVTALVSAIVLFWFGTSLVEGFALTFGLGVLLSMVSSFTVTRIFLFAIAPSTEGKIARFLFGSGLRS
jgi:protein-export membrane protein SecD